MNIIGFNKRFPNDDACLEFLVKEKDLGCCKKIYKIRGRRSYACQCGDQYSPTKGTIFHKSKIPLVKWFFAIYLHSQSKHGISSSELARHLGITYLAAYRINEKIRLVLGENKKLKGLIEMDETYIGGSKKGKRGRGAGGKTPLFGLVERSGRAVVKVVPNVRRHTLERIVDKSVEKGSVLYTDEFRPYDHLKKKYKHYVINHSSKLYVQGHIHTNTIEGLWSIMKRSIRGTYVNVSREKLQGYADQMVFMYNMRIEKTHPFDLMLKKSIDY